MSPKLSIQPLSTPGLPPAASAIVYPGGRKPIGWKASATRKRLFQYALNTPSPLRACPGRRPGGGLGRGVSGGTLTQHLQYMPFGETFVEQRSITSYYTPYTFSARERDTETGYSYFGARYYSSDISGWLSVDPMADKSPFINSRNYCGWNPIGFIDPTGLLEGDYYTMSGIYLGSDGGKDGKVYMVNTSIPKYGGYTQNELKDLGGLAGKGNFVIDITATTGINSEQSLYLTALNYNENENFEAKLAQANASFNRIESLRNKGAFSKNLNSFSGKKTSNHHKDLMEKAGRYADFYNSTTSERNDNKSMRNSIVAVLNALSGGYDYSNGATGWHGIDVTLPEWKAHKDFAVKGGFKWADDAIVMGSITPKTFPGRQGLRKSQYYTITASYGKSIYWRPSS